MPDVIDCPSCRRKLRRPEGVAGQLVRCPACAATFLPTPPAESPPVDAEVVEPPPERPRPLGGREPVLSLDDEEGPPQPVRGVPPPLLPLRPVPVPPGPAPAPSRAEPPPYASYRIRRRYDYEPHRGGLILTLGLLGLLLAPTCVLSPVGLLLGLTAWVMGHNDLAKMRAEVMDPAGQGNTAGGRACGLLATLLGGLLSLLCGLNALR
jgi:LSD1 subclass zinc finger protein